MTFRERRRRGREFPRRTESRTAGKTVVGNRRQVLQAGGREKLGKDINYSEAGITVRETRDLWDMPAIFLLLLMLRSGEWLLRRKWGVI